MKRLYETTVVIITDYDPTFQVEIDELARDAMYGEAYCTSQSTKAVDAYELESCVQEFFNCGSDEADEDDQD